jgi:hypothetical protein
VNSASTSLSNPTNACPTDGCPTDGCPTVGCPTVAPCVVVNHTRSLHLGECRGLQG